MEKMKISAAAMETGASVTAIRQAVRQGRLRVELKDGRQVVDVDAVRRVCRGRRVGRSGIAGVTWYARKQTWRAVVNQKTVYESRDKMDCAAALERYKRGELKKPSRDLPVNVYPEGAGRYRVMIRRGGEIVYSEAAATVDEAVAIRDNFLRNSRGAGGEK